MVLVPLLLQVTKQKQWRKEESSAAFEPGVRKVLLDSLSQILLLAPTHCRVNLPSIVFFPPTNSFQSSFFSFFFFFFIILVSSNVNSCLYDDFFQWFKPNYMFSVKPCWTRTLGIRHGTNVGLEISDSYVTLWRWTYLLVLRQENTGALTFAVFSWRITKRIRPSSRCPKLKPSLQWDF